MNQEEFIIEKILASELKIPGWILFRICSYRNKIFYFFEKIFIVVVRVCWSVFSTLGEKYPQEEKQQIIERIKSMLILCLYCNTKTPLVATNIESSITYSDSHYTAFFICPNCSNKFLVKIQDVGRVAVY